MYSVDIHDTQMLGILGTIQQGRWSKVLLCAHIKTLKLFPKLHICLFKRSELVGGKLKSLKAKPWMRED